jgi:tetratricopeptide (TPR) repeat protein
MARRILDVFLSSTALDLEPHRVAIHAGLMSTGLFHCQEDFGSQNAGAVEYCCKKVKAADIFIGLTGHRRGWEPDGDNAKRSITEMEHDWAKETGRRRYLYVAPDDFKAPSNLRDSDELHGRQQAFRKRVMDGGERIVSQKGFENPERFGADIVNHLLIQVVTSDLITLLRPELSPQSPVSPDEQQPALAAVIERLVEDNDVDLLALAKNPKNVDLVDLEAKLRARAEAQETQGQAALKTSAEYWRHIGALAFLHNTQKALVAYQKAVALDPLDPEGWRYLGELQYRLGDLADAERSFECILALGKSTDDLKTQAIGCMRLEWIALERGDLTRAEALIADAIRFAEAAEWQEGLARVYGNLGNIHRIRGDLDKAEEMLLKSFKLEEYLGNKAGMATDYGNLGIIHHNRGNLDKAEQMQRKALALNEELGRKEGMARAYGNLGNIYKDRGDLDKAEEMHLTSLKLEEELGNKEGMAADYGNLGNIYQNRGDLDKAEKMQRRALTLNEELGHKVGMSIAYHNLGVIYQGKGDKAVMCECWRKERDLYREMGLAGKVAEVENRLELYECGDS